MIFVHVSAIGAMYYKHGMDTAFFNICVSSIGRAGALHMPMTISTLS
jgi:hypothetical protein